MHRFVAILLFTLRILTLSEGICDDFDVYEGIFHTICLKVFRNEKSFYDGQTFCQSQYGDLASIHDLMFNNFVRRTAVINNITDKIHIGFKYNRTDFYFQEAKYDEVYAWSDGTKRDYEHWDTSYPSHLIANCTAMQTGTIEGRWINVPCESELPFVCKRQPSDR